MLTDELLAALDGDDEIDDVAPVDDELDGGRPALPELTPPDLTETLQRLRGDVKPRRIATMDLEATEWTWPYAAAFYERGLPEPLIWTSRRTMPRKWPYKKKGPDCVDQFLSHFLTPGYLGVTCYAHNGGNYDFLPVFERMFCETRFPALGFKVKMASIQSCLFRLEVTHPDHEGKWILLDSTRTFPMSLERLGEAFVGAGKVKLEEILKVPRYRLYRELAKLKNEATLRKYLRRDVLLLYKGIRTFQRLVNEEGGNLKATVGSTAMDVFRRRFLGRKKIYLNRHFNTCPDLRPGAGNLTCQGCGAKFIRSAFYGGRTEIFTMLGGQLSRKERAALRRELAALHPKLAEPAGLDDEDLYYYDVNSMYPHCMLDPMPVGMASVVEGGCEADVLRQARTMIGIVDCEVYVPEGCYLPPLPVRARTRMVDGKAQKEALDPYDRRSPAKLIFPVGRFRGVWDTAELALLPLVGGRIEKVHKQSWFTSAPVFNDYVDHFYKLKEKCCELAGHTDGKEHREGCKGGWSPGRAEMGKRMNNHLFGKFGQGELQEELFLDPPDEQIGNLQLVGSIRTGIFMRYSPHKPEHVCPQLAVHITSLARVRLWKICTEVLRLGGRIFYTDTDSVICSFPKGRQPWASDTKLGSLKMEHKLRRAQFVLPKLYLIECADDCPCGWLKRKESRRKVKAKGMSPGLGRKLTAAAWMRITDLTEPPEDRQWKRRHIAKWKTAIDMYQKDQLRFFRVLSTKKAIQTTYDKRTPRKGGLETDPIVLTAKNTPLAPEGKIRDSQGKPGGLDEGLPF